MNKLEDFVAYYRNEHIYMLSIDICYSAVWFYVDMNRLIPDYKRLVKWSWIFKGQASDKRNPVLKEIADRCLKVAVESGIVTAKKPKCRCYIATCGGSYNATKLVAESIDDVVQLFTEMIEFCQQSNEEFEKEKLCRLKSELKTEENE